ncbi:unnamed protein product [Caenorhabditis brenneri]
MELRRQAIVAQLQSQLTVLHDLNRRIPLLNHRESKNQLSTNNIDWIEHISNKLCLFERLLEIWGQPLWEMAAHRVNETFFQLPNYKEKFEREIEPVQTDVQNREAFLWRMKRGFSQ